MSGNTTVSDTPEATAHAQARSKARSIIGYIDPGAQESSDNLDLITTVLMQFYHRGAVDALDTLKARMR